MMSDRINTKTKDKIGKSLMQLENWVAENGWAGYDPFSILEATFFMRLLRLPKILPLRVCRYPFFESIKIMPGFWIEILNCQKKINAKAMGLFAKAYLNLFEKKGSDEYLQKASFCLNWLETNYSVGCSGICWGYPFDWQTHVFIPKETPCSVVTFAGGDAFWKAYKLLGNEKYLNICERICHFFITDLNKDIISKSSLCFSYTPIDKMHVHNANLFVAEFLIRIGRELNNTEFQEIGMMATNYTLNCQRKDGAWPYYGPPDSFLYVVDHYHTGFVLRMLCSIYELLKDKFVLEALHKGFDYYINNLFENKTLPKYTDQSLYPIDIHSCSEGILCINKLKHLNLQADEILDNLINWTIDNMQSQEGYFYYWKRRFLTLKIPYIRWGQAWMLTALSEVY
jgi:hypothetical protein